MKWSWKIGRIAGIDLRMHATFTLLLGWVALSALWSGGSVAGAVGAVLFTGAVFATVVLHELGHALMARVFGIPTSEILLLPIGGVAKLEGMPKNPKQELLVAVAGPAVNVALALGLGALIVVTGTRVDPSADALAQPLLMRLLGVNVALAVFNLIPAFPLDGGRMLRALLAFRLSPLRATWIAVWFGRVFAVGFAIFGLLHAPMLTLIGVFIWLAGSAELAVARRTARQGSGQGSVATWRLPPGMAPGDRRVVASVFITRPSWEPPPSR